MKTIVIANQKGGVGKTTTATSLASILSRQGYKVLLIDADLQGNSTDTYRAKIDSTATLYDVILDEDRILINEAIQHTEVGDIIASDPLLRKADEVLNSDVEGLFRLQESLEQLKEYDYTIVDTAPTVNSLLYNCLIAADNVIIPITADRYGLQGLSQLSETICKIQKRQNPKLKIAGLLLVRYNARTNISREVRENLIDIAKQMNTRLFDTTIRESTKMREAQALRKTLIDYAENSTTALDYKNFTKEVLEVI